MYVLVWSQLHYVLQKNAPQAAPLVYNQAPVMFVPGAAPVYYPQPQQQGDSKFLLQ